MTTDLLNQYFDIRPMGVSVCDGIKPPTEAFDALLLSLGGDMDNLRWQTAAACNLYERYHRKQAHLMAASRFDCSPETIATWCYIERKVPYNARVNGLSIWFHKLVATVPDSALQRQYLETCLEHSWSESVFEQWLREQRQVDIPESHWQTDRQFEQEQAVYNLTNEVTASKAKAVMTQVSVSTIITRLDSILKLSLIDASENMSHILAELKAIVEELKQL